jgi:hypothetical protein
MLSGKALRQILDKMLKSPVAQEARVQVRLPDGQHFDITSLQLKTPVACFQNFMRERTSGALSQGAWTLPQVILVIMI